jgi:uncharacterized repeat protein (TIGR03803 family)
MQPVTRWSFRRLQLLRVVVSRSRYSGAGSDGAFPEAGLIDVAGTLYGTTYQGGTSGAGTVFKVSTSGKESVLYSFKGADGADPYAGLIAVNGTLYGTTQQGGSAGCESGYGCGTVFELSTSGKERVLHRFKGGTDGADPYAGLIALNGTFYGTTWHGGDSSACSYSSASGCGTVFEVNTSGNERVLYRFKGGKDGASPQAGLLAVKGVLYGTTGRGGSGCECGTVFRISP